MNLVLVAYRWNQQKSQALTEWIHHLPEVETVVVIDNYSEVSFNDPNYSVVLGSNRFAEFSGYQEGLSYLNDIHTPCLILNDTALAHHSQSLWCSQVVQWSTEGGDSVLGDPRREPIDTEHGTLSYYASWIFWLPTRQSIEDFASALAQVTEKWDEAYSKSRSYRTFINRYLKGSLFHGWKNAGLRDQKATDLKIRCIWAEHRLSLLHKAQGYHIMALSTNRAPILRAIDRFYSFRRRVQNFM